MLRIVGFKYAGKVKKCDSQLWRVNDKILRVIAPLGLLWKSLEKPRSKSHSTMSLKKVLRLTEQSVLLCGQAAVAAKYQRRTEILKNLFKDQMQPRKVLQKYEKYLATHGALFGQKFQSKLAKAKGKNNKVLD